MNSIRALTLVTSLICFSMADVAFAKTFVYVSNAEDGDIDGYEMSADGALTSLGKTEAGKLVMPMAVSPDRKHLYAIVRSEPLRVVTYSIDTAAGTLKSEAAAPLPDSMSYSSVDRNGHFLFTASFGGDKVAVNPIGADGLIRAAASQVIPTGHNAHSILADRANKYVYASNLGSSQILQFALDEKTGTLTPLDPPLVKVHPGNGPRHLAISKGNRYLYVLCELTGTIVQFAIDPKAGTLSEAAYVGSAPPQTDLHPGVVRESLSTTASSGANPAVLDADKTPRIWAADIDITPDGHFMYTTERTNSTISVLSIEPETGKLTYLASYSTEKQPRGIRVDPTGRFLVAAGEKSDHISVFKIDGQTGALTLNGRYPVGKDANWVVIVETP
ncbi:beta-propeller fold lactonase family protein [Bradyrhizobium sp. INPA03-11B]|uniref:lactonase family protein n=1 Tax=Bradyrhizobium sp. INPA03-11B TaxID=418598 RepID=UPI00338FF91C